MLTKHTADQICRTWNPLGRPCKQYHYHVEGQKSAWEGHALTLERLRHGLVRPLTSGNNRVANMAGQKLRGS